MSGIVHKESLPGQGNIKRRRVDGPSPAAVSMTKANEEANKAASHSEDGGEGESDLRASPAQKEHLKTSTDQSTAAAAMTSKSAQASSSSSSSSDSDDDDSDDEIERENARLAKLREQRHRHQEKSSSGATTSREAAKSANAPPERQASASGVGANSYDHDVLFRNAAWRVSSRPTTADGKQKEKWNSVLNRTQDSVAHRHFMKKFFK
ncbi:hypothetical protein ABB37_07469 [Leptomonas pyrrhocoris]|uniref:Uncharacterized protein n=1 Tax=Leptomonas pyrrhocoris TaxID=157538 RepID=A0A0N0DT60_LEPPY|nr:hypothetical protein ABB37_07469 [Leptomonas pyrrhocoris]KPA76604.1 hypothetical protein ABB37_07469 [Leptomonas pyrrhocoris]|eukprot:XP_015655043.1 hypothetical protein ABB37_07469 [Leptomonas pyrrhocoris]